MYQSVIRDCVSQINQENVVCPHFPQSQRLYAA